MKIIACLGNPGKKYSKNRHNAGFITGHILAKDYGISIKKKSFNSIYGTGYIDNIDTLILFPQTFMNNSGLAVRSALKFYRETAENLIVVHDEIEFSFGEVNTKFGGGHKGHNGIRSIIQHIDTSDFYRIRFGVGRPQSIEISVADYLLSNFTKEELKKIEELYPLVKDTIVSTIQLER